MNSNKLKNTKLDDNIEILKEIVNMRNQALKDKPHIKKYYELREIHGEIARSMLQYYYDGHYDFQAEITKITPAIKKELNNNLSKFKFDFDTNAPEYNSILVELIFNKNHPQMTSLTEVYLQKKKYKSAEKLKILEAMNQSYVGLFKVISTDYEDAYVELEDVFTKKRFKIIDVAGSLSEKIAKSAYMYNRIITVDDISFGTGIHILIKTDIREINNYIKNNKKKHPSDIVRFLDLYNIFKSPNNKIITHSNLISKKKLTS